MNTPNPEPIEKIRSHARAFLKLLSEYNIDSAALFITLQLDSKSVFITEFSGNDFANYGQITAWLHRRNATYTTLGRNEGSQTHA